MNSAELRHHNGGAVDGRVHAFCDILSRFSSDKLEPVLAGSGIAPSPETVEGVLRRSYSAPSAAVKFFRWAGRWIKHTPLCWNLVVDILGKSCLFEPMWDAIRSMKTEGALGLATFASAFGSYCLAGKIDEAIMTFDVMDQYDVPKDVVAVNCLISAICRCKGHTADAADFLDRIKSKIAPDGDSYAILLEGWEKEGNAARAKTTFGEMVVRIGWNSDNMSAYDAFLTTLILGPQPDEAMQFLQVMMSKNCLPGFKFFSSALDILVEKNLHILALTLWNNMVKDGGLIPNLTMYNGMITVLCRNNDLNSVFQLFDGMPFVGVFPDSVIYNAIFECLIVNKNVSKAESFFIEMRKNEQLPTASNCAAAIKMFFSQYNPAAAFDVWNCVLEDKIEPRDESAAELLLGLLYLRRLNEVRRLAMDFLDRGITLQLSTMERLKAAFYKVGRENDYDWIERIMKA